MPTHRIKTPTRFTLAALAAAVLVTGALALPALAHDRGGHDGGRDGGRHERVMRHGAFGPGHGPAMGFFEEFDTDDDGKLTQAEIDGVRQERLKKFDANGDGTLSLEEYRALWMDAVNERMVRGFQRHDADGDGSVTAEEFNSRFDNMVRRMDRDGDGDLDRDDRAPRRDGGPR